MAENKVNMKQLGVSGLRRFGGYVYEEFMSNLRWPWAGDVYKEMKDNDAVIGGILYLAEMMIRNIDWTVETKGKSAREKEAAKLIEECMNDMDTSWADFISEILSMLPYGFSFHEIIYKVRRGPDEADSRYRSKYTDGKIGWRRIPSRSQHSLHEWDFADDGDIKGFVQMAAPDYQVITIPLEKGLLFRTSVVNDNPEGRSLLRTAYRSWYFKKRIEEIEGIGIERDLAGLPVLQAPEGMDLWNTEDERMVALKANAENLVASIRRDAEEGVLLPFGWDLKLLSSGSSRQFDTNQIIGRYDNRIAITMLSDLILIGGEKTGSFALAESKESLLATALEAQLWNIADVLNKYAVPKLLKLNGYTDLKEDPKIVPGQVQTPALKEIALLLRSMGIDITGDMELMNYLRKRADMPPMDEKTFKEVYKDQNKKPEEPKLDANGKPVKPKGDKANNDDTVDNDMEQNDLDYQK